MTGFTEDGAGPEHGPLTAEGGRVLLDAEEQLVVVDGEVADSIGGIKLELLSMLLGKNGSLLPTSEICEEIWGEDSDSARKCLNVHLMGLRRGLGEELGDTREGLIETVKRFGYRIRSAAASRGVPESAYLAGDERLAVDPDEPAIWVDQKPVEVTPSEYLIGRELTRRPDRLVGIGTLIRIARADGVASTRVSVQTHVGGLRKKIGENSAEASDDLGDFRRGVIRTGSKAHPLAYFAVKSLDPA